MTEKRERDINGVGLPTRPTNGLSLCGGGGGLDMGLHLAEPNFRTLCWVEVEEYPRSVIVAGQRAGYFAPAPIWYDVTTFDGRPFRGSIDTILAGYPCQPFSAAGQRMGEDDERHLWPDVARIIREIEPRWVFLENVSGHVSLGLDTVLRELWDMGWTPATGIFSAGETGAPHERQRVFIVAYRAGAGCGQLADTSGAGSQGREQCGSPDQRDGTPAHGSTAERSRPWLFPPRPGDSAAWSACLAVAPGLAPAVAFGDLARRAAQLVQMVEKGELAEAEAQSELCLMADGMASRSRALRLLGNGVFPLAAGYAWRTLSAAHGLGPVDLEAAGGSARTGPNGDVLT